MIPSEIGGGFGGKTTVYVEPLAVALAQEGRPAGARLVMTREEVFRATGPAPASVIRLRLGARRDGRLTAAEGWLAYEAGAFPGSPIEAGVMAMPRALRPGRTSGSRASTSA